MATVRILRAVAGLDFSWKKGDLVDMDDDRAAQWADGVRAELADQAPPAPPAPAASASRDAGDGAPPDDADNADDGGEGQEGDEDGQDEDLFHPADHPVKDVLAYLDGVGEEEAMRVLRLEENADQPRRGIVGQRGSILERAQANDTRSIERAAEASRGGGRGDTTETR
jgi:hypothetical protein